MLSIGCVVTILAMLFPPVHFDLNGSSGFFPFRWIGDLDPRLQIQSTSLLIRLAVVAGITGALVLVTKPSKA
jgi:hypothetical protein